MSELRTLENLYQATRHLGIEQRLDAVLDEIVARVGDLVGGDRCALWLRDEDSEELVVRRASGFRADLLATRVQTGDGAAGRAAAQRRPVREGGADRSSRRGPAVDGTRSSLAVPLVVGDRLVGVIDVASPNRDAFTEEHEKLLSVLGAHAALAILAALTRTELQAEIERLDALYRISVLSWQQKSFDEVVHEVLNETQKILPEGELAILLLDAERQSLTVRVGRGYASQVEGMKIAVGRGITGRCAQSGQVQVVDDVTLDPEYIPGVPGARSEVALPLISDNQVIGVLSAESQKVGSYDAGDVRFLQAIARQVAAVLHTTQLQQEAQRLAISDPLTELFNRRYFQERLANDLNRAGRYGERLALAFFDLDHFKAINDRHGHPAGDRVLQEVAATLKACGRSSDLVARIGGEEFAVLLQHSGAPQARAAGERMRRSIGDLEVEIGQGGTVRLTTSVGVALFPEHGKELTELFSAADRALYEAKRLGRDRIVILDPPS